MSDPADVLSPQEFEALVRAMDRATYRFSACEHNGQGCYPDRADEPDAPLLTTDEWAERSDAAEAKVLAAYAALRERVTRLAEENEKTFSEYAGRTVMAEHALTVRTIERDEARRLAEQERDDGQLASEALASVTGLPVPRKRILPWEAPLGERGDTGNG